MSRDIHLSSSFSTKQGENIIDSDHASSSLPLLPRASGLSPDVMLDFGSPSRELFPEEDLPAGLGVLSQTGGMDAEDMEFAIDYPYPEFDSDLFVHHDRHMPDPLGDWNQDLAATNFDIDLDKQLATLLPDHTLIPSQQTDHDSVGVGEEPAFEQGSARCQSLSKAAKTQNKSAAKPARKYASCARNKEITSDPKTGNCKRRVSRKDSNNEKKVKSAKSNFTLVTADTADFNLNHQPVLSQNNISCEPAQDLKFCEEEIHNPDTLRNFLLSTDQTGFIDNGEAAVQTVLVDDNEEFADQTVFIDDNGEVVEQTVFIDNGEVADQTVFIDDNGEVVEQTVFIDNGEVADQTVFIDDNGEVVEQTVFIDNGEDADQTVFIDDNGNIIDQTVPWNICSDGVSVFDDDMVGLPRVLNFPARPPLNHSSHFMEQENVDSEMEMFCDLNDANVHGGVTIQLKDTAEPTGATSVSCKHMLDDDQVGLLQVLAYDIDSGSSTSLDPAAPNQMQMTLEANEEQPILASGVGTIAAEELTQDLLPDLISGSNRQEIGVQKKKREKTITRPVELFPPRLCSKDRSVTMSNNATCEQSENIDVGDPLPRTTPALQTTLPLLQYPNQIFICPFDADKKPDRAESEKEMRSHNRISTALVLEERCRSEFRKASETVESLKSSNFMGQIKSSEGSFYCGYQSMKRKTVREILKEAGFGQKPREPELAVPRRRRGPKVLPGSLQKRRGRKRKAEEQPVLPDQQGIKPPSCRKQKLHHHSEDKEKSSADCVQEGPHRSGDTQKNSADCVQAGLPRSGDKEKSSADCAQDGPRRSGDKEKSSADCVQEGPPQQSSADCVQAGPPHSGDKEKSSADCAQDGPRRSGDKEKSSADCVQEGPRRSGDKEKSSADCVQEGPTQQNSADCVQEGPHRSGDKEKSSADCVQAGPRRSGDKEKSSADCVQAGPHRSGDKEKSSADCVQAGPHRSGDKEKSSAGCVQAGPPQTDLAKGLRSLAGDKLSKSCGQAAGVGQEADVAAAVDSDPRQLPVAVGTPGLCDSTPQVEDRVTLDVHCQEGERTSTDCGGSLDVAASLDNDYMEMAESESYSLGQGVLENGLSLSVPLQSSSAGEVRESCQAGVVDVSTAPSTLMDVRRSKKKKTTLTLGKSVPDETIADSDSILLSQSKGIVAPKTPLCKFSDPLIQRPKKKKKTLTPGKPAPDKTIADSDSMGKPVLDETIADSDSILLSQSKGIVAPKTPPCEFSDPLIRCPKKKKKPLTPGKSVPDKTIADFDGNSLSQGSGIAAPKTPLSKLSDPLIQCPKKKKKPLTPGKSVPDKTIADSDDILLSQGSGIAAPKKPLCKFSDPLIRCPKKKKKPLTPGKSVPYKTIADSDSILLSQGSGIAAPKTPICKFSDPLIQCPKKKKKPLTPGKSVPDKTIADSDGILLSQGSGIAAPKTPLCKFPSRRRCPKKSSGKTRSSNSAVSTELNETQTRSNKLGSSFVSCCGLDINSLPIVRRQDKFIDSEAIYNGEIESLYRAPFVLVVKQQTEQMISLTMAGCGVVAEKNCCGEKTKDAEEETGLPSAGKENGAKTMHAPELELVASPSPSQNNSITDVSLLTKGVLMASALHDTVDLLDMSDVQECQVPRLQPFVSYEPLKKKTDGPTENRNIDSQPNAVSTECQHAIEFTESQHTIEAIASQHTIVSTESQHTIVSTESQHTIVSTETESRHTIESTESQHSIEFTESQHTIEPVESQHTTISTESLHKHTTGSIESQHAITTGSFESQHAITTGSFESIYDLMNEDIAGVPCHAACSADPVTVDSGSSLVSSPSPLSRQSSLYPAVQTCFFWPEDSDTVDTNTLPADAPVPRKESSLTETIAIHSFPDNMINDEGEETGQGLLMAGESERDVLGSEMSRVSFSESSFANFNAASLEDLVRHCDSMTNLEDFIENCLFETSEESVEDRGLKRATKADAMRPSLLPQSSPEAQTSDSLVFGDDDLDTTTRGQLDVVCQTEFCDILTSPSSVPFSPSAESNGSCLYESRDDLNGVAPALPAPPLHLLTARPDFSPAVEPSMLSGERLTPSGEIMTSVQEVSVRVGEKLTTLDVLRCDDNAPSTSSRDDFLKISSVQIPDTCSNDDYQKTSSVQTSDIFSNDIYLETGSVRIPDTFSNDDYLNTGSVQIPDTYSNDDFLKADSFQSTTTEVVESTIQQLLDSLPCGTLDSDVPPSDSTHLITHNLATATRDIANSTYNLDTYTYSLDNCTHTFATSSHNIATPTNTIATSNYNLSTSDHNIANLDFNLTTSNQSVGNLSYDLVTSADNPATPTRNHANINLSTHNLETSMLNLETHQHNQASCTDFATTQTCNFATATCDLATHQQNLATSTNYLATPTSNRVIPSHYITNPTHNPAQLSEVACDVQESISVDSNSSFETLLESFTQNYASVADNTAVLCSKSADRRYNSEKQPISSESCVPSTDLTQYVESLSLFGTDCGQTEAEVPLKQHSKKYVLSPGIGDLAAPVAVFVEQSNRLEPCVSATIDIQSACCDAAITLENSQQNPGSTLDQWAEGSASEERNTVEHQMNPDHTTLYSSLPETWCDLASEEQSKFEVGDPGKRHVSDIDSSHMCLHNDMCAHPEEVRGLNERVSNSKQTPLPTSACAIPLEIPCQLMPLDPESGTACSTDDQGVLDASSVSPLTSLVNMGDLPNSKAACHQITDIVKTDSSVGELSPYCSSQSSPFFVPVAFSYTSDPECQAGVITPMSCLQYECQNSDLPSSVLSDPLINCDLVPDVQCEVPSLPWSLNPSTDSAIDDEDAFMHLGFATEACSANTSLPVSVSPVAVNSEVTTCGSLSLKKSTMPVSAEKGGLRPKGSVSSACASVPVAPVPSYPWASTLPHLSAVDGAAFIDTDTPVTCTTTSDANIFLSDAFTSALHTFCSASDIVTSALDNVISASNVDTPKNATNTANCASDIVISVPDTSTSASDAVNRALNTISSAFPTITGVSDNFPCGSSASDTAAAASDTAAVASYATKMASHTVNGAPHTSASDTFTSTLDNASVTRTSKTINGGSDTVIPEPDTFFNVSKIFTSVSDAFACLPDAFTGASDIISSASDTVDHALNSSLMVDCKDTHTASSGESANFHVPLTLSGCSQPRILDTSSRENTMTTTTVVHFSPLSSTSLSGPLHQNGLLNPSCVSNSGGTQNSSGPLDSSGRQNCNDLVGSSAGQNSSEPLDSNGTQNCNGPVSSDPRENNSGSLDSSGTRNCNGPINSIPRQNNSGPLDSSGAGNCNVPVNSALSSGGPVDSNAVTETCTAGVSSQVAPPTREESSERGLIMAPPPVSSTGLWTSDVKFLVTPADPKRYQPPCPCHRVKVGGKTEELSVIPFSPALLNCPTVNALPLPAAFPDHLPQNPCSLREGVYEYSPSAADLHMAQTLQETRSQKGLKAPDLHCKNYNICTICIGDFLFTVSDEKYSEASTVYVSFFKKKLIYKMVLTQPVDGESGEGSAARHSVVSTQVPFSSIVGLWGSDDKLLLELSSPPLMVLLPPNGRADGSKPIDLTSGQIRKVPYHFLTFQWRIVNTLKRNLCEINSLFCDQLARPLVVDLHKTFLASVSPEQGSSGKHAVIESSYRLDMCQSCVCISGCNNLRCYCFKGKQACTGSCRCKKCANQYNQLLGLRLSMDRVLEDFCLTDKLPQVKKVSKFLDTAVSLECCGADVKLVDCVPGVRQCPKCSAHLRLSWCLSKVFLEKSRTPHNHCLTCRRCVKAFWTHCKVCRHCTKRKKNGDCLICSQNAAVEKAIKRNQKAANK